MFVCAVVLKIHAVPCSFRISCGIGIHVRVSVYMCICVCVYLCVCVCVCVFMLNVHVCCYTSGLLCIEGLLLTGFVFWFKCYRVDIQISQPVTLTPLRYPALQITVLHTC